MTTAPDPCLCELRISGFELRVCHHSVTVENDRSWASVRHSTQDHFQVSYPWASFFSVLSLSRACQWCPPSMASLIVLIAEVPGSFRWPPAQDPLATSLLDLPHWQPLCGRKSCGALSTECLQYSLWLWFWLQSRDKVKHSHSPTWEAAQSWGRHVSSIMDLQRVPVLFCGEADHLNLPSHKAGLLGFVLIKLI